MSRNEESRAIVRIEYLLATEPFISSEETRYYRNGIFIEPHLRAGANLVATDGHTLSCILDAEAIVTGAAQIWGKPFKQHLSVPWKAFKRDYKGVSGLQVYADLLHGPKGSEMRLVGAESAQQVFDGHGIEILSRKGKFVINGTFPEYRRVCPTICTAEKFVPAAFNASYAAKVASFGIALAEAASGCTERSTPLMLFTNDKGGPGVVRFASPNGFVVIMHMRADHIDPDVAKGGLPDWFFDHGEPLTVTTSSKAQATADAAA